MKIKILSAFIFLFTSILAPAQELISAENMGIQSSALITLLTGIETEYDVQVYKILYSSPDANGNSTQASGAIFIPINTGCTSFPILSYGHGTVLKKLDVPSQGNFESAIPALFAANGYIASAPDYIGLGESPGLHPYVHAETEATATINLIRAARVFFDDIDVEDNGELFITGYSQGGHSAMATYKYIQDNSLQDEFNVVAAAPASGPYNLSGTQTDVIVSDQPYSNPGYVVYLIMSYQLVYGNIYNELSEVFQSPYADMIPTYFDGEQNIYDMAVINDQLPQQVSDLLQESFLEDFDSNPQHPLRLALAENDNFDWTPEKPLRMYYCTGDEQVPFQNSLDAETAMLNNDAPDIDAVLSGPGNHSQCAFPALNNAFEFFNSLTTACSITAVETLNNELQWSVYPNPSNDILRISLPIAEGNLTLINSLGQRIHSQKVNSLECYISLRNYSEGMYYIVWETNDIRNTSKIIISAAR